MCFALFIMNGVTEKRRCTGLRWAATADCTGCIRMKIMWQPVICGMAKQERMLPGEQVAVFHLLKRWQGFYVREGNPKNIQEFTDLTREDVRMINREKGSGIRIFIDEMCKKLEIDPDKLRGYEDEASSHMIAATNVLRGSADVAIGIEKVASQMQGLDFIPLKQESYDIVFRKKDLKRSEFQKLLNIIRSDEFKSEAETMSGYDVSEMGKQLW